MPIKSMTGYGSGVASSQGVTVTVELSSVNRKQLDIHLRLSKELQNLEPQINKLITRKVARGRINGDVSIACSGKVKSNAVVVDEELVAMYVKKIRATATAMGLVDDLAASMLLTLPQVLRLEEAPIDAELIWATLVKAMGKALAGLVAMRREEGEALRIDLEGRLALLEAGLKQIEKRAPQVAKKYHTDLVKRIEGAGLDFPDNDNRLLKEVALFADRADITEETTRLNSHVAQMKKTMKSAKPVGRSMDFLAQEMFREINTIGSKGNDTAIVRDVVGFKAELERLREQVQNIE